MQAKELMSVQPRSVRTTDRLDAAARVLWENDCGFCPVVDASGALVGVLTALLHFDVFHLPFDEDLELPLKIALGPKLWPGLYGSDLLPMLVFAALGYALFRGARDPEPAK